MKPETKEEKRKKLLVFSGSTFLVLNDFKNNSFEVYDPYRVPILLRVLLCGYWIYSLVGFIISRIGNDKLVSKIYFNINR